MGIAIKAENLGKAYQLGEIGTGTLSRDLERYWAKLRGKEDPFLRIGETNDRSQKGNSDIVWSLKDINFEIEQGDAIGIIGHNGAGKSTLLKILSRVTSPSVGNVKIKGRVASLLEVGTGFHPELTGRENIFLNGAILGMRKKEIAKKFDEIVAFAGIERYVDTPVKRYSSGMYVRLAFAVAAHLESEILVVDEVLAVGDAEFQKKCLGKMNEVSKGEGRTVLFVSHNMTAIKSLCRNILVLKNGLILFDGDTKSGIDSYLRESQFNTYSYAYNSESNNIIYCTDKLILKKVEAINKNLFSINEDVKICIRYLIKDTIENFNLSVVLKDIEKVNVFNTISPIYNKLEPGTYESYFVIPKKLLNNIRYSLRLLFVSNSKAFMDIDDIIQWDATETEERESSWYGKFTGVIRPILKWETHSINL